MKSELKHVSREKPLQLFWTKRLSSLNPLNMDEEERTDERVYLTPKLSSFGPGWHHMLLASISAHLQANHHVLDRQEPCGLHHPNQPLTSKVEVSDEDISGQEARQKLAMAVKALG